MSCTTDYVDGVPSMIVGFRNADDAQQWLGPFAEHIGAPFCAAANRNGREARVYMTVGTDSGEQARRWSCELGKWGDWFANAPAESAPTPSAPSPSPSPDRQAPPQTVADAIRACNDVQSNREVPVTCRTDYVNGVPAMIVGFPNATDAEAYMDQVAERVAGPFCEAANRASRRALLFITLANAQARHFDCEQQTWGEWFELTERKAANRNTL